MRADAQQITDRLNLLLLSGNAGCSMSVGGAFSGDDNHTFNRFYEHADQALYLAKDLGRGRLCMQGDLREGT